MTSKLLIAGHIAKDVTADGWRPGGGSLYAASQASRLGLEVTVLTACASDVDPAELLQDVRWQVQHSEATTTFENVYVGGHRSQRLLAQASKLDFSVIDDAQESPQIVLLTPLFHEIEPASIGRVATSSTILGVASQGWLRQLDGDRVCPVAFEESPAWLAGEVVFVSEEDVSDPEGVAVWQQGVPVVALTRGRGGCTVWDASGRHEVSAAAVSEQDPTGAGDVFAAAFLVRYEETRDAKEAARFAAAAGALSVRGEGFESVATREEIEALLKQGQVKVA